MDISKTTVLYEQQTSDACRRRRRADSPGIAAAAAVGAFLLTNVRIGGTVSPFGTSLAASLGTVGGIAVFVGAAVSAAVSGSIWKNIAELASVALTVLYGHIFGGKPAEKYIAPVSGIIYFLCSCAVSAGSGAAALMFAAAFIRSILCALMTVCFEETGDIISRGIYRRKESGGICDSESFRLAAPAVVYITIIAAASAQNMGILNPGRIAAGFFCCAAARKFGSKGGAAAGILSAAGFLLCDQSLARCGAMLAFASMISGHYNIKGKYAVNIAFICGCFGITAAAGMPSGTPEFIADMGAAAVLYCIIPESLYITKLNGIFAAENREGVFAADRLSFAADIISEVGHDAKDAAYMLRKSREKQRVSLSEGVRQRVCRTLCNEECTAAACDVIDGCFKTAQGITEKNGSISSAELPAGFEGCKNRSRLASEYSLLYRMNRYEARSGSYAKRLMESVSEQLDARCAMIRSFCEELSPERKEDPVLTEAAQRILQRSGINARSVRVSFDGALHPFCECFAYARDSFSDVLLSDITDRLSSLLGAELERPVVLSAADKKDGLVRIRWWGDAIYTVDCRVESDAAEGGVCGDSWITFEDGFGDHYVILSDGMGRGGRAAAESAMALSLLKRLILSGMGNESALMTLNSLLSAVGADEVFATVDMLVICCYTGKATLYKLGAAATIVYDPDGENGQLCEYDESSAPLGITAGTLPEKLSFDLDEHSRLIMTTDGVNASSAYMRTLLENEKLTCEQIAEKLIAYCSERDMESDESFRRRDDKTAAAVRLYRCRKS